MEWIIKIPIFHWYLIPFCWRLLRPAMLLFQKLISETQISKPPEPSMDCIWNAASSVKNGFFNNKRAIQLKLLINKHVSIFFSKHELFYQTEQKFLIIWLIRLVCIRYSKCPTQILLKQLNSAHCVRMAVCDSKNTGSYRL